jgi:hypothetical protein
MKLILALLLLAQVAFAQVDELGTIEQANRVIIDGNANRLPFPIELKRKINAAIADSDAAIMKLPLPIEFKLKLTQSFPAGGAEESSLLTDLISYWKLDEASGTRADSVTASANDLTDNNTVTATTGKQGDAAHFVNANDESLSKASNDSLRCGNIDFTVAMWVRLTDKAAYYYIGGKRTVGNIEWELEFAQGSDRFFGTSDAGAVTATNGGSPTAGVWYFLVLWHDAAANTISIQVNNGTANSTATGGTSPGLTTGAVVLGDIGPGIAPGSELNGDIDEVGFWKRTLTADEKASLYNSGSGVTYPAFAMKDFKKLMYFLVGYKPIKEKPQHKNDFYL